MAWFDVHTHLDTLPPASRAAMLQRGRAAGMAGWVISAGHPDRWAQVRAVAEAHQMPWTWGLHPWWTADLSDAEAAPYLDQLASSPSPHGIGELGLDHARATTPPKRANQRRLFRAQLALARDHDLPVVLHGARAWGPLIEVLHADGLPAAGGMVHAWEGPPELAQQAVRLGLCLSFGPSLFRNKRSRKSLRAVPEHAVLFETDTPDRPVPGALQGEPAHVLTVLAEAARLRGETIPALCRTTAKNARRLFPALPRTSP